jgi:hypothetical protein
MFDEKVGALLEDSFLDESPYASLETLKPTTRNAGIVRR